MSVRDEIKTLRGYNQFAIQKNLDGVSQSDSLHQPTPGGNCLNWVLGHIVLHRNPMLKLLGEEPVWTEEEAEPYARGSEPLVHASKAHTVDKLLADAEASHARLDAALDRATDDVLARPVAEGKDTSVGTSLIGLQFHEAYHAGQLGILRRLAGHDAALK